MKINLVLLTIILVGCSKIENRSISVQTSAYRITIDTNNLGSMIRAELCYIDSTKKEVIKCINR